MESVIERIKKQKFFKFAGGIHPPEQKFLTFDKPIKTIALAKELILPVKQHIGKAGDLLVQVGQKVLKGQALTKNDNPMCVPVHAPTSGTITAIKPSVMAHPSGMSDLCIFITPDGSDTWIKRNIVENFKSLSKADIVNKIAAAGISGMGGAGFPTNIKVNTKPGIKFLIINAAECEPYITSDDLLMRERSAAIFNGLSILNYLLEPENILIGIEDNKPLAIKALKAATIDCENIHVCVLPTKYPTGGEKQLVQALTGQEVPSGILPVSLGIVVQNVATVFAISEAIIDDKPLIRRVVTVTGQALKKPQNLWVPLGTPISHVLEQCGFNQNESEQRIIMGGPLMGFTLPSLKVPVVKTTNCILAPTVAEISPATKELECIRCGQCAEVCPSSLLPQELQWHAKAKEYDQLENLNLFDCIDCGACAYVCPSQIPLVQYYRVAKAEIRQNKVQEAQAEKAKIRFEARNIRLEKEKLAREEKHKKAMAARKAATSPEQAKSNNSAVAAALARVKAKKAAQASGTDVPVVEEADVKTRAAQAIARAKAKKAAASKASSAEQSQENPETTKTSDQSSSSADEKKARTAAVVAKAKAKKAAAAKTAAAEQSQEKPATTKTSEKSSSSADEKKARTAAVVAKAKAKKAAAAKTAAVEQSQEKPETTKTTDQSSSSADQKKARTAAVVAKAKAKKAAAAKTAAVEQSQEKPETTKTSEKSSSSAVQKKASTAAVVAKAKTKKAAVKKKVVKDDKSSAQEEFDLVLDNKSDSAAAKQVDINAVELKKQKIAAAVAKAKAKKATMTENLETETKTVSLSDTDKKAKIATAIAKAKTARAEKNKESE